MLRVLLKAKSEELGVASKLIANSADLDSLASVTEQYPLCRVGDIKFF